MTQALICPTAQEESKAGLPVSDCLEIPVFSDLESDSDNNISISRNGSEVNIVLDELMNPNTVHIYNLNGALVYRMSNKISHSFPAPEKALYLLSMVYGADNKRFNKRIAF